MSGQNVLRDRIIAVETQMRAKLEEIRRSFEHSGTKGNIVEDVLRSFLREYTPRRLEIGYGEIIDLKGQRSKQTDVVIVSEDHPFTFAADSPGIFFVEGVLAAGEVKTILTSNELEEAVKAAMQFRNLEVDLETGGIVTYTNPSDKERFYKSPPYFLVAFESQIKLNRVIEIIESLVGQFESEKKRTLDGIFILDQGWAIDFGDGKGAFQYGTGENDSISGWACSDSSNTLWDLLGWLSITMPRVKRYMPILAPYFVSKRLINNED